jgi:hypothetical protein
LPPALCNLSGDPFSVSSLAWLPTSADAATRFGVDRGATVTPLDGEQIRAEFL